ncbi:peptidase dimerization domain-containing protein [Nocardioides sp. YIM 152315]|uniref:M20 family metallopeptidase n=1 Tax=Nocardioides sp. YIM 152315 TaxID=3031760 RepID=UPI0023DA4C13|nr:peptidase dimerization domain-containing protein [Nocardioides sp. YIM 152315]MDF1604497.1 peptidase dimerization domain-containing protein [Nocardioides sp. YIM 152315]
MSTQRELDATVAAVMEHVTRERLAELVVGVVDIPSPTGGEGPLAAWIAARLRAQGVRGQLQELDERQANAVGVLAGSGGPSLLLYAPLDTFTVGDPAHDVPWAATVERPDMAPHAVVHGDLVEGLAAGNPKGHAATIMAVVEAFAAAGVVPPGDLVAGFGAGGMPSFAVDGAGVPGRANTGHGVGATFLLERGWTTDYAVIAKPGWTVSHEEVGLVWIDVVIPGWHTYVGSRHRMPYRNAVALAARVATDLEEWFGEYAERHEHATMRPQGIVAGVHGGDDRLAAATPAVVRLRLDVRLTTEQTGPGVVREVRAEVQQICEELGVDEVSVEQVAYVPATRTAHDSPVVRAATEAFETVSGGPHIPIGQNSGATDANILRMRGVPTARVGMPKVPRAPDGGEVDFTLGMNLVDLGEMRRLAEILVRTVLALPHHAPG